jgi:flagellar export protein FliJ
MNKTRITRLARLVALREQQQRVREAEHAAAIRLVRIAEERQLGCSERCEALDLEHDESLAREVSPLDLELLGIARSRAAEDLREAEIEVSEATEQAEARRDDLLSAHRAHRSLEIYHERVVHVFLREVARTEQRELDEMATRACVRRRAQR